ncbi:hypothetical protein GCM10010339_49560 [Streptomyces alanosinicus]|uniref:Uncharacterized protein n=1 Tax=Streptomyces alanosinicus TaxID=68171 RepID=A0A918YKA2_9ACTN|nr:hypothetical protein GCM10010339_49560 [Streptomyces alanosinicus]
MSSQVRPLIRVGLRLLFEFRSPRDDATRFHGPAPRTPRYTQDTEDKDTEDTRACRACRTSAPTETPPGAALARREAFRP